MPPLHDANLRTFASDNYSGVHPEVLRAMAEANGGHVVSYGEDPYTERLGERVRELFGPDARAFPVFNGTGANVVALQTMQPRWGAVVCAASAHIVTDEGGAPERVAGMKLYPVATPDGKLTADLVRSEMFGFGFVHRAQPAVVSTTQSTELGTVYRPEEIRAIAEVAHDHGLTVHMDGARLANAAVSLGLSLRALTTDVGVDVVSFGGTKNGLPVGDLVIALTPDAAPGLEHIRKFDMQLASKMRFISAAFLALLDGDLWAKSARQANAMAARLRGALEGEPGIRFTQPTEANSLFAILPRGAADTAREAFRFYDWNAATGEVRWVCSFDTTEKDVDTFAAAIRAAVRQTLARE